MMTMWQMRQIVETHTPVWAFLLGILIAAVAIFIWEKRQ